MRSWPETLTSLVTAIEPARRADPALVRERLDHLTKPPGSLGHLEDIALRLALIYGDPPPSLRRRVVFVLAADHGVAERGVSAYPAAVTAQMCRNFAAGGAAINAIARSVGADVVAVDIGVNAELGDLEGLLHRKVRRGSRDLASEAALTSEETAQAISIGAALVAERADTLDLVALGDMGIGNTTAASALTAALTGHAAAKVVGPGSGIGGERLTQKRAIVERAVRRAAASDDPFEILQQVGGLEIAGLAGVVLGAARAHTAVVSDGFIATAAALVAVRLCPTARDYLFASHRSTERGHQVLLDALGLRPPFDLDLRLGEGTGAALCLPVLEAAAAILREMATFASAGVSGRTAERPNV